MNEKKAMEMLETLMKENRDILIRLKEGRVKEIKMKNKKGHIHCPVNAWDCPYFDANGCCMMYPDSDPLKECDDFACFWDEGDDYICYENH